MSTRVQISIEDHVAEVLLNRPEKHNALDMQMFDELAAAGARLSAESSVRAVILTGAGENFCAGIDLSIFNDPGNAIGPASMAPQEGSHANRFQRAAFAWREVPVPVICAIRGVAFGGGTQIALGADLRYAAPDAKMSVMEIRWGLIPDLAISVTASNLVREDLLRELAYTGRVVSGSEALEIGMVTAVCEDPLSKARDTARLIAGRSPDAIRGMKTLFNERFGLDAGRSLSLEAELQSHIIGQANQMEAVRANIEGREPEFGDWTDAGKRNFGRPEPLK
ncbi:MAG: crotonase/enoyl-CoA hydratase family protein [Gammaproteobacteria bacterium]|nr:crotonase/enoyl-CoA hydratase family protein [Gammaproteobacteria bacterium]